jgi:Family of unknown function (DUF5723)
MSKNRLLFFSFVLAPILAFGQLDLSSHFLNNTWQSYQTNPGLLPKNRITIALPSVYGYGQFSGFTLGDLVRNDGQNNFLDVDNVIGKLGPNNQLQGRLDINTLGVGFHAGDWYLSAGHTLRQQAFIEYPKELAQLIWLGNALFIGQEVQLAPKVDVRGYQELFFGLSRKIGENLSLGARVKVINGYTDLSAQSRDLRLSTSGDIYQLKVKADYTLRGTADILRYDSLGNAAIFLDTLRTRADWTKNTGYGMDLGLSYRLGNLELAAGLLDIGQINWRDNVNSIRLKGEFEFDGVDVLGEFLGDTLDVGVILDTLEARLDVQQNQAAYVSLLPAQYYLSARWRISESLQLGALAYAERVQSTWLPAFGLSAQFDLGSALQVGGMYIMRNRRFDNFGANAALTLGPVQFVLATDNLLSFVRSRQANSGSLRMGLNLVLGNMERNEKSKGKGLPSEKKFF